MQHLDSVTLLLQHDHDQHVRCCLMALHAVAGPKHLRRAVHSVLGRYRDPGAPPGSHLRLYLPNDWIASATSPAYGDTTKPPAAAAAATDTTAAGVAKELTTAAGLRDADRPLDPGLYVVGTPIGNLEDISFRALRVLNNVNLILAEDTRHTRKLLQYFSIKTSTLSYHQHNERQRQQLVMQRLQQGEPIALVSDAGMPAISDPGALLVAAAVAAGVRVVSVPGPCAAIAALAASGLATDSFHFVGFLPPKSSKRCEKLQQLATLPATLVFYVPPHGLGTILSDMVTVFKPGRQAVVARELTKLHEEFYRAPLSDLLDEFGPSGRRGGTVKGELVLLVEGCAEDTAAQLLSAAVSRDTAQVPAGSHPPDSDQVLRQLVHQELAAGSSVSQTSKQLSKQFKVPRSKVYKIALELQPDVHGSN